MIDWYLSLPKATWRQRLWALACLVVAWLNLASQWGNLHGDIAIARWIAWCMVAVAVFLTPPCLLVLLADRAPRSFAFRPGSLHKTLPQIQADIEREHEERERSSREF